MTITGAIVMYAVFWFMTLLVIFPIGYQSQEDAGDVEPGTPASAPAGPMVGRKVKQATIFATIMWVVVCGIIMSGWISIDDIDWTKQWRG